MFPDAAYTISGNRYQPPLYFTARAWGLAAARASLADQASASTVRSRNARIRTSFLSWLEQRGFKAIPSDTNFVMVEIGRPVPPVIDALERRGFLVGRLFPSMPTHLRISLGTEEQMARFQRVLGEVLRSWGQLLLA